MAKEPARGSSKRVGRSGQAHHALKVYCSPSQVWRKIQQTGRKQDFSWSRSSEHDEYLFMKMLAQPKAPYS